MIETNCIKCGNLFTHDKMWKGEIITTCLDCQFPEDERLSIREYSNEKAKILEAKYKDMSIEEIVFNKELDYYEKKHLLIECYDHDVIGAHEIICTVRKEIRKAKTRAVKRNIKKKVSEKYSNIPPNRREPIPDNVMSFVWQRDGGKCVKCGNQEKLEFDHIIPVSKGGSNTKRNIQLLCENCNRSKKDNI